MPITVELQDMFRYSWIPVAIAVIVVVVVGVAGLVYFIKHKKEKPVEQVAKPQPAPKPVNEVQIRDKYCSLIDELEVTYKNGYISNRKAYQQVSEILRQFVFELTGVKVHNFTLEEIKRVNMPNLTQIIDECYAPEFSVDKEGNIDDTIKKTRMVIREWR